MDSISKQRTQLLRDILVAAQTALKENHNFDFNLKGYGKLSISTAYQDREKVYSVTPSFERNGECIVLDSHLANSRDYSELLVCCSACLDQLEELRAMEHLTTEPAKQNRFVIPLTENNLVVEQNLDLNFPSEVIICLEDKEGQWLQDLTMVREAYHWEESQKGPVYENKMQVLVWSDVNKEEYTHEFTVDFFAPERESSSHEDLTPAKKTSLDSKIKSASARSGETEPPSKAIVHDANEPVI